MTETPADRLRQARIKAGFDSAASAAQSLGWGEASYRHHENGTRNFDATRAIVYGRAFKVDPGWLLGIKGENQYPPTAIDDAYLSITSSEEGLRIALAEKYRLALVPQLDLTLSMGGGAIIDHYEQVAVRAFDIDWLRSVSSGKIEKLVVVKAQGDSMTPTLLHEDTVLVDTAQTTIHRQDEIWALTYGDLGMIKRVRRKPRGVFEIMSDNISVSTFNADAADLFVIGRVVWIGRRI